jgi:shikimate kinase
LGRPQSFWGKGAALKYHRRVSVFLIGPMGAGKTAVGKALARLLRYEFVDSDAEIERRTGVDIPFIFEREGEAGFRAREREVIRDLSARPGIVLATGGGAVLASENRACLAERGFVVYLETSIERQLERTRHSRNRPLLDTEDRRARLLELTAVREPLYRSTAAFVVATDGRRVEPVAALIAQAFAQAQKPPAPPAPPA